jgi:curved DNA-binding protein CbpA
MEEGDDAYAILGVTETADEKAIRTAYRKLALQYHPDKIVIPQSSQSQTNPNQDDNHTNNDDATLEERKRLANAQFAKISNAYEILSDPVQRREYDASRRRRPEQPRVPPASRFDPPEDLFHASTSSSSASSFFHMFHFHDPFEIFQSVFFGDNNPENTDWEEEEEDAFFRSNNNNNRPQSTASSTSSSSFHTSFMNQHHPQQSPFLFGTAMNHNILGRTGDIFGGVGGFRDPWTTMMFGNNRMMEDVMMNPFRMMMDMGNPLRNTVTTHNGLMNSMQLLSSMNNATTAAATMTGASFFSSNMMSSTGGAGTAAAGGVSVSKSTRIINGRVETVTERIVRKPDGTIERHVQTSSSGNMDPGGSNLPQTRMLPSTASSSSSSSSSQPLLSTTAARPFAIYGPSNPIIQNEPMINTNTMANTTTSTTTNASTTTTKPSRNKRRSPTPSQPSNYPDTVTHTTSTSSTNPTAAAHYSDPTPKRRKQRKVSR